MICQSKKHHVENIFLTTTFAGSHKPGIPKESSEMPHVGSVPALSFSGRVIRQGFPGLKSINLFEVSSIPSSNEHNPILALEKISLKPSRPHNDFQRIPHLPYEDVVNSNFSHHAPPLLSQQLYQSSNLQPSKDFELVKEINLHPRVKASPRAASFSKQTPRSCTGVSHQSAQKSVVLDSDHASSATAGSHLNEKLTLNSRSKHVLDGALCSNIINGIVEEAPGDQQRLQSNPHVSFVDIRFAYCLLNFSQSTFEVYLWDGFHNSYMLNQASQEYASSELDGQFNHHQQSFLPFLSS
jgi:hypothetical protein